MKSPYEVYFSIHKGIGYFNAKAPYSKPEILVVDNSYGFDEMSTFTVFDDIFVFGDTEGHLNVYSSLDNKYMHKHFAVA